MSSTTTTTTAAAAAATKPPSPLIYLDQRLSHSLHTLTKPFLPIPLLLLLEYSADFRLFFPISLALLLARTTSESAVDVHRQFLYPFIAGLLLDLPLVGLVKIIFRRSRPHYNHQSMKAVVHADSYSFPSGHASRVWFVATAVNFGAKVWESGFAIEPRTAEVVEFAFWVWAAVTALSRVLLGRHYLLDVISGACLGVAEAVVVFRFIRF
ncbi:probable lipid phosphate phosphatase beta [Rutidosis leptorrhynchoides]|uniref:probable lipid phosphate phosphatase beta n=1 Tax=Rutidosis leptorrhynchoides TaxID=125765 RepID=UPI003A99982F